MENASKALIIAGEMFITLLIASLLVITFSQIRNSYLTEEETLTIDQVAKFNNEFEAFNRPDITGFELVSLINKIMDYNVRNADVSTSDRGYVTMTITVKLKQHGKLFSKSTYTATAGDISNNESNLIKKIRNIQQIERKSVINMSTLVDKAASVSESNWEEEVKNIFKLDSIQAQNIPTYNEMLQYREYQEFKRANYKCTTKYNENTGRIVEMIFSQQ